MMTHEIFEDLLLLHMTHSISEADRVTLFTHLESCADCRAALVEWQRIATAVRMNAEEKRMITTATRFRSSPTRVQRPLLPSVIILAAVIFIAYFVIFQRPTASFAPLAAQIATPTPTPTIYVEIVLSAHELASGTILNDSDVTLYRLPVDDAPFNGVVSIADVVGKYARTNIECGMPIQSNLLVGSPDEVAASAPALSASSTCDLTPLREPIETKQVVVAVREFPSGRAITDADVQTRPYPAQLLPKTAITSLDEALDQVTSAQIYQEQVLTSGMMQPVPFQPVHVSIPVELINNADSTFKAGDVIDVVATMLFLNVDPTYQAPVGTPSLVIPVPADTHQITQRVVSDALVFSLTHDDSGKLISVTVSVTPDQAAVLTWVIEAKLSLVLSLTPPR